MSTFRTALFGGTLLAAGMPAFGQSAALGDEASFQASLAEFDFEDFNGAAYGYLPQATQFFNGFSVTPDGASPFGGDFAIVSYSADASYALGLFVDSTPGYIPSFTLVFDSAVTSVGFDFTGGDSAGGVTASFAGGSVLLSEDTLPGYDGFGSGYVVLSADDAFTSITFSPGVTLEFFTIDNVTSGTIPAPGAAGLLAMAGLTAARRRRC